MYSYKIILYISTVGVCLGEKQLSYEIPPSNEYLTDGSNSELKNFDLAETSTESVVRKTGLESVIPGIPEVDYPILDRIPETSFSCDGLITGGYYSDMEAECQAFHVCVADREGRFTKHSFLCPIGSIFNQNYLICDWWFNFDCSSAEGLYNRNKELSMEGKPSDEKENTAGKSTESQSNYVDSASSSYEAPSPPILGYQERNERPMRNQFGKRFQNP